MPAINELLKEEAPVNVPATLFVCSDGHLGKLVENLVDVDDDNMFIEVDPNQPCVLCDARSYSDHKVTTNNQEGDVVNNGIYQFLTHTRRVDTETKKVVDLHFLITTSIFKDEKEEECYRKSVASNYIEGAKAVRNERGQIELIGGLLAIKPGAMRHRLMEERVLKQGMHFRAISFSSKSLNDIEDLKAKADKQTVFWATEENTHFLSIEPNLGQKFWDPSLVLDGDENFGFDLLGVIQEYDAKMMKRDQEILRSTDKNLYFANKSDVEWVKFEDLFTYDRMVQDILYPNKRIVIAEFSTPQEKVNLFGENALMLYDGANVVDAELVVAALKDQLSHHAEGSSALRSIERQLRQLIKAINKNEYDIVGRYTFRLLGEKGLVKGDALAVVGLKERTGADVVAHSENFKRKIRTTGWTVISFENHDPLHVSNWDVQSTINFRNALSTEQELADLKLFKKWAEDQISDPEPPKWVTRVQDFHSEDSDDDDLAVGKLGAQDYERYQAYGRDVREAQNFTALWLNIATQKMDRAYVKATGWYNKPFLPQSNAASVGLMTYAVLEDMALLDLSGVDKSVCTFMPNVGMLWPDDRHIATFDLAGTKDLDDTSTAHKRMVFCSNPKYMAKLIEDDVIKAAVPTTEDEAVMRAVIVRSPNGAGEYSVEEVSEYFFDDIAEDLDNGAFDPDAPVLDLAKMPRGITHLVKALGDELSLGSDPVREAFVGQPFTREQAHYILEAQAMNPGIGMVCNTLMLWTLVMGSVLPTTMIQTLGEMVDAVQQGHDHVAIGNVLVQPILIQEELADAIAANPKLKVDTSFVANRFAGVKSDAMDIIRGRCTPGRASRFSKEYHKVYLHIRDTVKKQVMDMRANTRLAVAVQGLRFSPKVMQEAQLLYTNLSRTLKDFNDHYVAHGFRPPTFAVTHMRMAKALAVKELVEKTVANLKEDPATTDRKIMALYKHVVSPTAQGWKGLFDQCIFRSGGADVALFDLLAQAVDRRAAVLGL
jgi:hypothetical protein